MGVGSRGGNIGWNCPSIPECRPVSWQGRNSRSVVFVDLYSVLCQVGMKVKKCCLDPLTFVLELRVSKGRTNVKPFARELERDRPTGEQGLEWTLAVPSDELQAGDPSVPHIGTLSIRDG